VTYFLTNITNYYAEWAYILGTDIHETYTHFTLYSCGICWLVVWWKNANVSEKPTTSIFKANGDSFDKKLAF